jgi:hypothetical protein
MSDHIFIAIIAALVNLVLSIIVPCALKNNRNLLPEVRKMLEQHRATLISSSVLVAVIVFIALTVADEVRPSVPAGVLRLAQLSQ